MATRPTQVAKVVNDATEGTPCYRAPAPLSGNKETAKKKRGPIEVIHVDDDSTHRPEYVTVTRDRRESGRPRKINFVDVVVEEAPIQRPNPKREPEECKGGRAEGE